MKLDSVHCACDPHVRRSCGAIGDGDVPAFHAAWDLLHPGQPGT
jgi:hypothetical protein